MLTDDFELYQYRETSKYVRARKTHRCARCGEMIQPGDVYERVNGIMGDRIFNHPFFTYPQHGNPRCAEVDSPTHIG